MSEQQQNKTITKPKYPNDPDQTMWLTLTKNGNRLAFNHIVKNTSSPFTIIVTRCSKTGMRLRMLPKRSFYEPMLGSTLIMTSISFQLGCFQLPPTTAATG